DQGSDVRKVTIEESKHFCFGRQRSEASVAFKRQYAGKRKRSVQVGNSDEHAAPARPNMQRVLLHLERVVLAWWQVDFLVTAIEKILPVVGAFAAINLLSHRGESSICADNEIAFDLCVLVRVVVY